MFEPGTIADMSIFFPNQALFGTGFILRLNETLWLLWMLASAAALYYVCIAMPVVALVDHMHVRRRRKLFGDERVWVKDLLAAEGHPALQPSGLPGRHRCTKRRPTRQELLYRYVGWPFRPPDQCRPPRPATRPLRTRRHVRA